MTVAELIQKLSAMPQDALVFATEVDSGMEYLRTPTVALAKVDTFGGGRDRYWASDAAEASPAVFL